MPDSEPEDVDDRVLSAAIRVFASEPTSQVTLKRVALEAGVPADQVISRWSSTTALLTGAVDRLTEDMTAAAGGATSTRGGDLCERQDALLDQAVHLSARAVLDQIDPTEFKGQFPMSDTLVRHFERQGADLRTARYRAYQLMVIEFGYRLFSSSLLVACGLEDENPCQVRAEIDALQDLVSQRTVDTDTADQVA